MKGYKFEKMYLIEQLMRKYLRKIEIQFEHLSIEEQFFIIDQLDIVVNDMSSFILEDNDDS